MPIIPGSLNYRQAGTLWLPAINSCKSAYNSIGLLGSRRWRSIKLDRLRTESAELIARPISLGKRKSLLDCLNGSTFGKASCLKNNDSILAQNKRVGHDNSLGYLPAVIGGSLVEHPGFAGLDPGEAVRGNKLSSRELKRRVQLKQSSNIQTVPTPAVPPISPQTAKIAIALGFPTDLRSVGRTFPIVPRRAPTEGTSDGTGVQSVRTGVQNAMTGAPIAFDHPTSSAGKRLGHHRRNFWHREIADESKYESGSVFQNYTTQISSSSAYEKENSRRVEASQNRANRQKWQTHDKKTMLLKNSVHARRMLRPKNGEMVPWPAEMSCPVARAQRREAKKKPFKLSSNAYNVKGEIMKFQIDVILNSQLSQYLTAVLPSTPISSIIKSTNS